MGAKKRSEPIGAGPLRVICAGCGRPISADVTLDSQAGPICPNCAPPSEEKTTERKSPAA